MPTLGSQTDCPFALLEEVIPFHCSDRHCAGYVGKRGWKSERVERWVQVQQTLEGWRLYLRQPILPASIAYITLYFNAVLGPGGLMTAFLASRGLNGTAAALFR